MPAPESARTHAVRQLNRIEQEGAFIGLVSGDEDAEADARTERQATEYIAGVTRWRRRLDFILGGFYRGDLAKMEPLLRQILRVGVYDLLFLDTPPHAALNEAVELAKRLVRTGAGGLVNGILRNVLRNRDALPAPATGDPAEDLAIHHSHPTWMVRRWLERYGPEETEALLRWNNERPVYTLRINTLKIAPAAFQTMLDEKEVAWTPSPYLDYLVRVPRLQSVVREGWLADGLCAVQDESAALAVALLDPRPGETLIDTCSAPGGKSLHAAMRMNDAGRIFALDLHASRLRLVRDAAEAQGVTIIDTRPGDLREFARSLPRADRVLLDAPCSGLGVLAKRADLRWNRSPEEIAEAVRLQDDLLDAAAVLVRPGGLLVYSTCSIEPEENEHRITAFLARQDAFTLQPAAGHVPDATVTPEGYYQTFPPHHHTDGAFAALLQKNP